MADEDIVAEIVMGEDIVTEIMTEEEMGGGNYADSGDGKDCDRGYC